MTLGHQLSRQFPPPTAFPAFGYVIQKASNVLSFPSAMADGDDSGELFHPKGSLRQTDNLSGNRSMLPPPTLPRSHPPKVQRPGHRE